MIEVNEFILVHKASRKPVQYGDVVRDVAIVGGRPPHKSSSSGYVWVNEPAASKETATREYYATVVDCYWYDTVNKRAFGQPDDCAPIM